ncbi:aldo/keto reductase [Candidatus Woesearchaeota archaeon]|nr:aldo/keto reductase [Candidatus Woesearchaeota archaeon]
MNKESYLIYGTYRLPRKYKTFREIILKCQSMGIKWIDTANLYNRGKSESWIGRVKAELKDSFQMKIATKAGKFLDRDNNLVISLDKEVILSHINTSLNRLKVDKLDALFLHNYDNKSSLKEVSNLIKEIIATKKVYRVGLSNFPMAFVFKLIKHKLINLVEIEHNKVNNNREYILACQKKTIECWVYRPFLRGELIRAGRNPQEIITSIHKSFPSTKIVFGATKLKQIS